MRSRSRPRPDRRVRADEIEPRGSGFPLAASVVPLAGAGVMWAATGSASMLWFAALSPLMALAAVLDGRRVARRERKRAAAARRRDAVLAANRRTGEQDDERDRLRAVHPDLRAYARSPDEIWRVVPGRSGALVVGRGDVPSGTRAERLRSVDDDEDGATRTVPDAPVVVPLRSVAVVGPPALAAGVVRALSLQALCQYPPGALCLAEPVPEWAEDAPHRSPAPVRLVCHRPGAPGEVGIFSVTPGEPVPPATEAVLTLLAADRAVLDHAGERRTVGIEAVSRAQAVAVTAVLADRAGPLAASRPPGPVAWAALPVPELPDAGLPAVVGADAAGPVVLDLVAQGPHAVVAGITGSGKSELLVTWVLAMAAVRGAERVTFLLVDFKGGTAFQRLSGLPHVLGVVTDLDAGGAGRAIESLRAEIRRREQVLAERGVTDVADPRSALPRLVIVVDEFAALVAQSPDLADVFVDVAARGRALGMHVVLGTQRAAGVMREGLLANCPLRLSLRVSDPADSRFLLGTDVAATSPDATRGVAFVRTPEAAAPVAVRVALTGPADIETVAARSADAAAIAPPWLPPLPERLPLSTLPADISGAIVLGLSDRPEAQRQTPVHLERTASGLAVLGGPASGRSGLLAAVEVQGRDALVLPRRAEEAWDVVAALESDPPPAGRLLLCDDLDVLLTRFPADYASALVDRMVLLVRGCGLRPVVSVQRPGGAVGRVIDLCDRRLLLRQPTRLDHLAVGAPADRWDPAAPRGRGSLDGVSVQCVEAAVRRQRDPADPETWAPGTAATAVVLSGGGALRRLTDALGRSGVPVQAPGEADLSAPGPLVVAGDPDLWQRSWSVFTAIRAAGDVVVDAACATEYRVFAGERSMPPYCEPGRGRAWLRPAAGGVRRVVLPSQAATEQALRG